VSGFLPRGRAIRTSGALNLRHSKSINGFWTDNENDLSRCCCDCDSSGDVSGHDPSAGTPFEERVNQLILVTELSTLFQGIRFIVNSCNGKTKPRFSSSAYFPVETNMSDVMVRLTRAFPLPAVSLKSKAGVGLCSVSLGRLVLHD
jgi:hypothetical protein